jgi:hypothetical protein
MGLKDLFVTKPQIVESADDVAASLAPVNNSGGLYNYFNYFGSSGITATRAEFMSVPTCARARNIVCSSNFIDSA